MTGEGVALELGPAGLPSRLAAALVDLAVMSLLLVGVSGVLAAGGGSSDDAAAALGILAYVGALLGYPVLCETFTRGRTLGKALFGLRVVRDDGGPVTLRHALVRGLVGLTLERPGLTLGTAALVTSALHPQGKRLGDLLAGTVVLRDRVPGTRGGVGTWSAAAAPAAPPADWPGRAWSQHLDLSGLRPDLLAALRTWEARSPGWTAAARTQVEADLLAALEGRARVAAPVGVPAGQVLQAVLSEHRARSADSRNAR